MKTKFLLVDSDCDVAGIAEIITKHGNPNTSLNIRVDKGITELWVQNHQLEKLALNIIKSLKSKKLKNKRRVIV